MKKIMMLIGLCFLFILVGCTTNNNRDISYSYVFIGEDERTFQTTLTTKNELNSIKQKINVIEKNLKEITLDEPNYNQSTVSTFGFSYNEYRGGRYYYYTFALYYKIVDSKLEYTIHKNKQEMRVRVHSKVLMEYIYSSKEEDTLVNYTFGLYYNETPNGLQTQKYILKISESDDNLVYKFGGFTSTNSNYQ